MPPGEQPQVQLPLIWVNDVAVMLSLISFINARDTSAVEVAFAGGSSIVLNAQESFALLTAMGRNRVQPPTNGAMKPFGMK